MYKKLLSKELTRKKTMNSILLIFIVMASMFLGSAVQNLIVSTTAIDLFFRKAFVADEIVILARTQSEMTEWEQRFAECKEIKEWSSDEAIIGVDNYLYGPGNTRFKEVKVKRGEIAIPSRFADSMGLQLGDTITLKKIRLKNALKPVV